MLQKFKFTQYNVVFWMYSLSTRKEAHLIFTCMRLNCQFKGAFNNLIIRITWILKFFSPVYKEKTAKHGFQFYTILASLLSNILQSKAPTKPPSPTTKLL